MKQIGSWNAYLFNSIPELPLLAPLYSFLSELTDIHPWLLCAVFGMHDYYFIHGYLPKSAMLSDIYGQNALYLT